MSSGEIKPIPYQAEGRLWYRVDVVVRDNLDRPVRIRRRRFRSVQEARRWAVQAALRVAAGERIARPRGQKNAASTLDDLAAALETAAAALETAAAALQQSQNALAKLRQTR